ncbi:MAG: type IV pilus modification protein PilV [Gammaproteobacteria bacterium]|nr:type IV pilus modification protein PilV [Gammaproteobacteria bacterium]
MLLSVIVSKRSKAKGFSLIEVLVTLIIMSFGLLGVATMQITNLKHNQSAYYRTQAINLAYQLSDQMRSNINGVLNGAYNNGDVIANADCQNSIGCNSLQMAANDLYQWLNINSQDSVSSLLPQGTGTVCIDSTPNDGCIANSQCDGIGSIYAIKTFWVDRKDKTTVAVDDCSNYQSSNELRFSMVFMP